MNQIKKSTTRISSANKDRSKIKALFTGVLLTLSLGLVLGIINTPQDIRQRAQNTPGRTPATPPQCAAAADNTGVCVATTDGCYPGEEQDEGQLDCTTGQTCCGLAPVPEQCLAASKGQTFCATAANCTTLYTGMNLGQLDCADGIICCQNPAAATNTPAPTEPIDPTPTFESISVPTETPTEAPIDEPTAVPDPTNPPAQTPPPASPANNGGLLGILIQLILLIFSLIGLA